MIEIFELRLPNSVKKIGNKEMAPAIKLKQLNGAARFNSIRGDNVKSQLTEET